MPPAHTHAAIHSITAYCRPPWRTGVWWLTILLTGGLAWVAELWRPGLFTWMYGGTTLDGNMADFVVIVHENRATFREELVLVLLFSRLLMTRLQSIDPRRRHLFTASFGSTSTKLAVSLDRKTLWTTTVRCFTI